MRLWPVVVGWFLLSAAAQAEEAPRLGGLPRQTGWANLGIAQGRLTVLNVPPRSERTASLADPAGHASESLCVKSEGADTSFRYEFNSPHQRVTIEVVGGRRVEIHRTPQEDASPVELHLVQASGGQLTLTIGAGAQRREFSAPDFWRLMLAEPDVARDCLTPLLESLRPDWGLRRQTAEIEQRLFELAGSAPAPDAAQWEGLIGQLGDRSFVRREAADRQLRAVGPALLPFLEQVDRRRLDAEQRARLEGIRQAMITPQEDTPARVAARLLNDQTTWLALLTREDAAQRSAAARQLCKLCPAAVNFDPQADQAARRSQLRRLRQQLARD